MNLGTFFSSTVNHPEILLPKPTQTTSSRRKLLLQKLKKIYDAFLNSKFDVPINTKRREERELEYRVTLSVQIRNLMSRIS